MYLSENLTEIETRERNKVHFIAKNTAISPDFLVWKFCEKTQFPHSFGRFA